jgi:hypothetical protein
MYIFLCFVGKHVIDWHFHQNEPSATKPALSSAAYNYLPCICIHFFLWYCFVYFPSLGCYHLVSAFLQLLFVRFLQPFCLQKNHIVTHSSCLLYPWFRILFLLCLCSQILPDVLVLTFIIPSWNLRILWPWRFKLRSSELLHFLVGSWFQKNMLPPSSLPT